MTQSLVQKALLEPLPLSHKACRFLRAR